MRSFIMILTTFVLMTLAVVHPLQAQDADKKDRTITVTGVGTVKFRPEGAKISFGVRASDNVFATAWKDNQTQATKLRDALEGLKLAGLQVKVAPPEVIHNDQLNNPNNIAPMPVPGGGGNDKTFVVSRSFQIVVTETDFDKLHQKVLKVMETALTHGANTPANTAANNAALFNGLQQNLSITRVEFFSGEDRVYREQAFKKAVQAALANARGAAAGADLKQPGNLATVTDQLEINYGQAAMFGLGGVAPTLDASQQDVNGEVEMTVRVRVTVKF